MNPPSSPAVQPVTVASEDVASRPCSPHAAVPVIVAGLDDLPLRGPLTVEVDGRRILIVRDGEDLYGVDATCTHAGGPLEQGTISGCLLACPWHGAVFDLRSGETIRGPARKPLHTYRVSCRDGRLTVEIPA